MASGVPRTRRRTRISLTSPSQPLAPEVPSSPVKENQSPKSTRSGANSPEPTCAICLGKLENKSFTDSCLHTFCFVCLLEWSKVKPVCPLCQQPFKRIIHNVRSIEDFDEYEVPPEVPEQPLWENPAGRRFRYRTTLTSDRILDQLSSFLLSPTSVTTRSQWRRRRQGATADFRRRLYNNNMWVHPATSGRVRNTSPEFFVANPACTHRLVPWLNRELLVLMNNQEENVQFLLELLIDLVKRFDVRSPEFHEHIYPFIGTRTAHFIHEFYHFARSPYDMITYDQRAFYEERSHPNEHERFESSDDSDVVVIDQIAHSPRVDELHNYAASGLGATSFSRHDNLREPPAERSGGPVEMTPLLLNQVHNIFHSVITSENTDPAHSGWESPIPGPSAFSSISFPSPSYQPLNLTTTSERTTSNIEKKSNLEPNDSDDSDVVVLGYQKPYAERTPIVISSDSDQEITKKYAKHSRWQAEVKRGDGHHRQKKRHHQSESRLSSRTHRRQQSGSCSPRQHRNRSRSHRHRSRSSRKRSQSREKSRHGRSPVHHSEGRDRSRDSTPPRTPYDLSRRRRFRLLDDFSRSWRTSQQRSTSPEVFETYNSNSSSRGRDCVRYDDGYPHRRHKRHRSRSKSRNHKSRAAFPEKSTRKRKHRKHKKSKKHKKCRHDDLQSENEAMPQTSVEEREKESKCTFKKHPTGHKNSKKLSISALDTPVGANVEVRTSETNHDVGKSPASNDTGTKDQNNQSSKCEEMPPVSKSASVDSLSDDQSKNHDNVSMCGSSKRSSDRFNDKSSSDRFNDKSSSDRLSDSKSSSNRLTSFGSSHQHDTNCSLGSSFHPSSAPSESNNEPHKQGQNCGSRCFDMFAETSMASDNSNSLVIDVVNITPEPSKLARSASSPSIHLPDSSSSVVIDVVNISPEQSKGYGLVEPSDRLRDVVDFRQKCIEWNAAFDGHCLSDDVKSPSDLVHERKTCTTHRTSVEFETAGMAQIITEELALSSESGKNSQGGEIYETKSDGDSRDKSFLPGQVIDGKMASLFEHHGQKEEVHSETSAAQMNNHNINNNASSELEVEAAVTNSNETSRKALATPVRDRSSPSATDCMHEDTTSTKTRLSSTSGVNQNSTVNDHHLDVTKNCSKIARVNGNSMMEEVSCVQEKSPINLTLPCLDPGRVPMIKGFSGSSYDESQNLSGRLPCQKNGGLVMLTRSELNPVDLSAKAFDRGKNSNEMESNTVELGTCSELMEDTFRPGETLCPIVPEIDDSSSCDDGSVLSNVDLRLCEQEPKSVEVRKVDSKEDPSSFMVSKETVDEMSNSIHADNKQFPPLGSRDHCKKAPGSNGNSLQESSYDSGSGAISGYCSDQKSSSEESVESSSRSSLTDDRDDITIDSDVEVTNIQAHPKQRLLAKKSSRLSRCGVSSDSDVECTGVVPKLNFPSRMHYYSSSVSSDTDVINCDLNISIHSPVDLMDSDVEVTRCVQKVDVHDSDTSSSPCSLRLTQEFLHQLRPLNYYSDGSLGELFDPDIGCSSNENNSNLALGYSWSNKMSRHQVKPVVHGINPVPTVVSHLRRGISKDPSVTSDTDSGSDSESIPGIGDNLNKRVISPGKKFLQDGCVEASGQTAASLHIEFDESDVDNISGTAISDSGPISCAESAKNLNNDLIDSGKKVVKDTNFQASDQMFNSSYKLLDDRCEENTHDPFLSHPVDVGNDNNLTSDIIGSGNESTKESHAIEVEAPGQISDDLHNLLDEGYGDNPSDLELSDSSRVASEGSVDNPSTNANGSGSKAIEDVCLKEKEASIQSSEPLNSSNNVLTESDRDNMSDLVMSDSGNGTYIDSADCLNSGTVSPKNKSSNDPTDLVSSEIGQGAHSKSAKNEESHDVM